MLMGKHVHRAVCGPPPGSALIRPGRFDMQVNVPKPDVKGRTEILNWYLKKIRVDPGRLDPLRFTSSDGFHIVFFYRFRCVILFRLLNE